jgi:DNA polymerase-3 subunit beta
MTKDISIKDGMSVDIQVSLVLDKFKTALSSLERVVSARSTLPILSNVLIKADKTGVELVGTDLEIGIRFFVGGKVEKEGSVTIPGKTLITLINSLHGETVTLMGHGDNITVTCGEVKAALNGVPADDYPVIPEVETGKRVKINGGRFRQMLSAVDFAASRDESRQILTGVYMVSDENGFTLAATDSYRLAEIVEPKPLAEQFKVIVPIKTITEVKRLLSDKQDVEMRVEESQVMFVFENAEIVSRVIEGEYPPYKSIIPAESQTLAVVDIQELSDAIKSAAIFSAEMSNSIKLNLLPGEPLTIASESSQLGNFKAGLSADVSGAGEEVSFNAKYVLDGLSSFDTPKCEIGVGSKTSPGVFKPVGEENRVYIVMPLRG